MTETSDHLDELLREAHRRGQVVMMHPTAGPVFVSMDADGAIGQRVLDVLARLDEMQSSPMRNSV